MPFADPVMDAGQPCLEICEDEMDDGQKLVVGVVIVTALAQVGVTAPVVRSTSPERPRHRQIREGIWRFGQRRPPAARAPHSAHRIACPARSSTLDFPQPTCVHVEN